MIDPIDVSWAPDLASLPLLVQGPLEPQNETVRAD